jgi:hypothetical protein
MGEWKKKEKTKKSITDCVMLGFRFVVNLKFKLNMQRANDYTSIIKKLGNVDRA